MDVDMADRDDIDDHDVKMDSDCDSASTFSSLSERLSEDDDDDDDDDDEPSDDAAVGYQRWYQEPLFAGSAMTISDTVFSLFALQARHPTTATATMKDLWRVVASILPTTNSLPSFRAALLFMRSRETEYSDLTFCPNKCHLYVEDEKQCPVCLTPRPPASDPNTVVSSFTACLSSCLF
jgi:hypothetical protein